MTLGNFGDSKSVGEGVFEMRVHFGPGYRIYFAKQDRAVVVLLCGGEKKSQRADIQTAKAYWTDYRRLVPGA